MRYLQLKKIKVGKNVKVGKMSEIQGLSEQGLEFGDRRRIKIWNNSSIGLLDMLDVQDLLKLVKML